MRCIITLANHHQSQPLLLYCQDILDIRDSEGAKIKMRFIGFNSHKFAEDPVRAGSKQGK
jgi:hypothetical protein